MLSLAVGAALAAVLVAGVVHGLRDRSAGVSRRPPTPTSGTPTPPNVARAPASLADAIRRLEQAVGK